ncbi:uncharacterized protein L3040_008230 [Drepanopeziza brunnea f. sp. 'multigermtubi']|uniref:uncharacterized protein n=1 Tax=Drepanopeziza brunnea f. sp. 'multigermtubi' TaxID=698441 RepID=UPI002388985E|nr:hypothetical protein L3040_008230 [Drepanopeziza brunnea f. sp. 'multigermtubi']
MLTPIMALQLYYFTLATPKTSVYNSDECSVVGMLRAIPSSRPLITDQESENLEAFVRILRADSFTLLGAIKAKKQYVTSIAALGVAQSTISSLTAIQDNYPDSLIKATSDWYKAKGEQDKADCDDLLAEANALYST